MEHTQHTPVALERPFLSKAYAWLLLFAGTLLVALSVSRVFLLPRFTQFTIGDTLLAPRELADWEQSLHAQLASMERDRIRLVLPFQDDLYSLLKEQKQELLSPEDVRRALRQAAARLQAENSVRLHEVSYEAQERRITVVGDVRDVGNSSMTVLALFLGEVERLPFVFALEHPPFSRVHDAAIGVHSPFRFHFSLAPAIP